MRTRQPTAPLRVLLKLVAPHGWRIAVRAADHGETAGFLVLASVAEANLLLAAILYGLPALLLAPPQTELAIYEQVGNLVGHGEVGEEVIRESLERSRVQWALLVLTEVLLDAAATEGVAATRNDGAGEELLVYGTDQHLGGRIDELQGICVVILRRVAYVLA